MKKEYLDNYRVRVDDYVSKAMIYTISDLSVFQIIKMEILLIKEIALGTFV